MPSRLWQAKKDLKASELSLSELKARKQTIQAIAQTGENKFKGYQQRIEVQQNELDDTLQLVKDSKLTYSHFLRQEAVNVLTEHLTFLKKLRSESYFYQAKFRDLVFSQQHPESFLNGSAESISFTHEIEQLMGQEVIYQHTNAD